MIPLRVEALVVVPRRVLEAWMVQALARAPPLVRARPLRLGVTLIESAVRPGLHPSMLKSRGPPRIQLRLLE